MDSSPLNMAHFHERRADKFLRHHRYEDAFKAIEMSLLYLQDAYKNVQIPKAREVLDTQKWDLERKLGQIKMRKQQYDQNRKKEILPPKKENISVLTLRTENNATAQSVAKSIDRTVREFDAKLNSAHEITPTRQSFRKQTKENYDLKRTGSATTEFSHENRLKSGANSSSSNISTILTDFNSSPVTMEDLPSLAPLELPVFDFDVFTQSSAPLTNTPGLAKDFQK